ncbi:glyoxalase [Pontibacillus chungwhensis BH030062]|uniref:Glyoxalase n=1 Tax=Pontibacillus chungwhensis BH030062 TaxID=1385513 RepID=A0A0A2UQH5_9BACI|nr:VOC family protein [Pontibacillus chungwhensis]KGP90547.1 glyoxalase [Pontibacillus chungwhensis BH030062]
MEITKVILKTNDIQSMKQFYKDVLEMEIILEGDQFFEVLVGESVLAFTSKDVEGEPYYHFAFNIPSNQFKEAKHWVQSRVQLNTEEGEDEADFSDLPAQSLYFYDPAGNIVEFIARHSISEGSGVPFSSNSLLKISEISITVTDAQSAGVRMGQIGIHERDQEPISGSVLNFMGSRKRGNSLLLIEPGRRWIFSDKKAEVHPLDVILGTGDRVVVNDQHTLEVNP